MSVPTIEPIKLKDYTVKQSKFDVVQEYLCVV